MKSKTNGFSLLEAMIVVGISATVTLGTFQYIKNKAAETNINALAAKTVKVIKGFDQRIFIDKYDASLWSNTTDYVTNIQVQDFLKRELIAKTASCGNTINGWTPVINNPSDSEEVAYKSSLQLIPCSLWDNGIFEFDLKSKLKIVKGVKNLEKINIYFYYDTPEEFTENALKLRQIQRKLKELDTNEITGSHNYKWVDMTKPDPSLYTFSTSECMKKLNNCGLMAQYRADGSGAEYLDVTGLNSMVDSKISFIERNGDPVIKTCSSFVYNTTLGTWDKKDNIVCGLGIDQDKGTKFVDIDVHNISTKNIYLDKTCTIKIGATNRTVPCGMYKNPDGSNTAITAAEEIHTTNAFVYLLDVNTIKTNMLTVNEDLNVLGETKLNKLNVAGETIFDKKVEMKGSGNIIEKDLSVKGLTNINALRVNDTAIFEKSVTINQDLEIINGGIKANSMILGTITKSQLNSACSSNLIGALKVYRNGEHTESVVCTSFKDITGRSKIAWKLANARIGQIMPFDGTCPDGFEYFEEAAGRFLIGENETLLKGKTASQIADLVNQKKVFLDPNGNVLRYKIGDKGGEAYHTLTIEEMPEHDHGVPTIKASCTGIDCAGDAFVRMDSRADTVWSRNSNVKSTPTGGNKSHENRPPYYTVNYCIYSGRN